MKPLQYRPLTQGCEGKTPQGNSLSLKPIQATSLKGLPLFRGQPSMAHADAQANLPLPSDIARHAFFQQASNADAHGCSRQGCRHFDALLGNRIEASCAVPPAAHDLTLGACAGPRDAFGENAQAALPLPTRARPHFAAPSELPQLERPIAALHT